MKEQIPSGKYLGDSAAHTGVLFFLGDHSPSSLTQLLALQCFPAVLSCISSSFIIIFFSRVLVQHNLLQYGWNQKFCFFSEGSLWATVLRANGAEAYLGNLYCFVFLIFYHLKLPYTYVSKIPGCCAFSRLGKCRMSSPSFHTLGKAWCSSQAHCHFEGRLCADGTAGGIHALPAALIWSQAVRSPAPLNFHAHASKTIQSHRVSIGWSPVEGWSVVSRGKTMCIIEMQII